MIQLFHQVSHECSKLTTKRYSTSFSSAINMLHPSLRQPVFDIYGFVRFADEIVDTFHDYDKAALLTKFKQETYDAIETKISLNPILNSFQITVNKYNIDKALIEAFFNSMEMDLSNVSYDEAGYNTYIYGSAEVVGLMCLYVFCEGDETAYNKLKPTAQSLGAAFQKINFLRDVKADNEQLNRTYFPGINFNHFTAADKAAIEKDIANDFAHAFEGILILPAKARFGVYLAYKYYISLFKKIKKSSPSLLLQNRIRVSDTFKTIIYLKASLRNSLNTL
ncbi:phytoene/squalene synthase family protein [Ferruginibacter yonginensis]|uniref:Phytoene/squalene synthase family protein n=1 Tax=Ferruginibacter yonginensis TaxID=1310416 RepID=A0ABV8QSP5_9BACT